MSRTKSRPVWLSKTILFHSCGPGCCDPLPKGTHEFKSGTKGELVNPTTAEKNRLRVLREKGDWFVVDIKGKRRFLERSSLQGEKERSTQVKKTKSKLSKLRRKKG